MKSLKQSSLKHLVKCPQKENQLLKRERHPLKAKLLLVSVNGERSSLDRELHEGDVLGFFFPVSGG